MEQGREGRNNSNRSRKVYSNRECKRCFTISKRIGTAATYDRGADQSGTGDEPYAKKVQHYFPWLQKQLFVVATVSKQGAP